MEQRRHRAKEAAGDGPLPVGAPQRRDQRAERRRVRLDVAARRQRAPRRRQPGERRPRRRLARPAPPRQRRQRQRRRRRRRRADHARRPQERHRPRRADELADGGEERHVAEVPGIERAPGRRERRLEVAEPVAVDHARRHRQVGDGNGDGGERAGPHGDAGAYAILPRVRTGLCTDERFRAHRAPREHPERPERLVAIERALAAARLPDGAGLVDRCQRVAARAATRAELELAHAPEYLDLARAHRRQGRLGLARPRHLLLRRHAGRRRCSPPAPPSTSRSRSPRARSTTASRSCARPATTPRATARWAFAC